MTRFDAIAYAIIGTATVYALALIAAALPILIQRGF